MMPAIHVDRVGKSYRLGELQKYKAMRDILTSAFGSPLRALRGRKEAGELMWALKDVSFDIAHGEVVGLIGRNGAGKSTLLKILSRITEPTEGYARVHGRVGSLLEVGTGFHPELTGRENIYLNGAILGMRRAEIDRKFDEIVAFSETGRFLDTPLKFYSSGMYVRLAFAVAAHMDTEILLVDEVLAVGDAEFQKRCLGKMSEVSQSGRTVVFVSHSMPAIQRLCMKVVWIDKGTVKTIGPATETIAAYLAANAKSEGYWSADVEGAKPKDPDARLVSLRVQSGGNRTQRIVSRTESFTLQLEYEVSRPFRDLSVSVGITDAYGLAVFYSHEGDSTDWEGRTRESGRYVSTCEIPGNLLQPGVYFVSVNLYVDQVKFIEQRDSLVSFEVSSVGSNVNGRLGVIAPVLKWKVDYQGGAR